jgi:hypothetical protein
MLTGGTQLGPGPFGERFHAQAVEYAVGDVQLLASLAAAAPAA